MANIKVKSIVKGRAPCPGPAPSPIPPPRPAPADPPIIAPPPPPFMPPGPCCPANTVVLNNTVVKSADGSIDVKEGYDHGKPAFFISVNPENVKPFEGATATEDGKGGAVPAPLAGDQDKFLKGDGSWSEIVPPDERQSDWAETDPALASYIKNKPRVDVYVGPTGQDAAIPGFVPAADLSEKDMFLKGDGTWAEAITEVDQVVDPSSENAVSGQAVASALGNLDDKMYALFNSIQAVPAQDAADIVKPEPGDGEDPLAFDVPNP